MHKWFLLPLLPLGIAIAYFFTGTNDEVLAQGKVVAAPQPALPALLPPAAPLAKAAVGEGLAAAIAELAGQKFRHGSAEGKLVALTFDDGPHPQMTPQVLAALKEAGVPATFFMVGTMLEKYPEVARQVAAEGHEIGGHSHSHKPLTSRTREQVREEIMRTQAAIRQVAGAAAEPLQVDDRHADHRALHPARVQVLDHAPDHFDAVQLIAVNRAGQAQDRPLADAVYHQDGRFTGRAVESLAP